MTVMINEVGLVLLLRVAWIAATLPILIASIPVSALNRFHAAMLGFAKRGKIMNHQSPSCNRFTVPQRFFLHFYVVAVVWTTFLLLLTWLYAYRTTSQLGLEYFNYSAIASHLTGGSHMFSFNKSRTTPAKHSYQIWQAVLLLLLMEVQVLRRLYETLNVFKYSPSARMHMFGYLTGLFFYTAAPLSLCSFCAPELLRYAAYLFVEFIVKGRDRVAAFEFDWWGYVKPLTKLGFCQWVGVAIFVWGWIHQYRCHAILGSLRDHKEEATEYAIPRGDWFEIVSSPHYLAEIVIYAGILVASGGSDLTIWLLFTFVVSNLVFAAAETQRWYLCKFDNYPVSRRAILPFLY
ncbi:polyprenol reductase 2-like isoform X1 [Magnolia sinica]|uniref:polyprenol reductase 2-like isoform X1 n=1 Tax=Magnolia sinica TaxID=86752 RepID=UPI0026589250|nr:polyprenol reductase 2-like isoform X1 [Magnolia sinica]XP_058080018.1 polyprenol reductase 2-like isoform X1 [Magnolia sinica]